MRVNIVANGTDDLIDLWNNPFGLSLDDRVTPLFTARGYQVISSSVDYVYGVAVLGLALPYQLKVTLETGAQASTVGALVALTNEVITQAVGVGPASVAITSAGQPAPGAPSDPIDTAINDTGSFITNLFGLAADTPKQTRILLWAVTIGGVALVYFIATQPGKAAKIVRA
jgi:hypothetical protein